MSPETIRDKAAALLVELGGGGLRDLPPTRQPDATLSLPTPRQ